MNKQIGAIRIRRNALAALALASTCIAAFLAGPQLTTAAPPSTTSVPLAPATPLTARVESARGTFRITLRTAEAPISCANFVNLVQRGAYDRSAFHDWTRVLRQSGGPAQSFDPGYTIRREFSAKLMFDGPGMVAMQKAPDGEHAHGTQFFVTVKEQSRWNLDIPIFGTIASGQEVVDALEKGDAITQIAIEGDPTPLLQRFTKEVAAWNTALDAAMIRARLPALRSPPAASTAPAVPAMPAMPAVPATPPLPPLPARPDTATEPFLPR